MNDLKTQFGNIDIYLFDQLLKGRFEKGDQVIDVGCGGGRNSYFLIKAGFDVFGIDQSEEAIAEIKQLAQEAMPDYPMERFQVGLVEQLPFDSAQFDWVIANAVLHFAHDQNHFEQMLHSIWRVLKPGGYMMARLASNIGIEHLVHDLGNGRFLLPDESERFLVSEKMLLDYTTQLNGELVEWIKTTNVQNLRCMTTWCLRK